MWTVRKLVILVGVLWLGVAVYATWLAVQRELPYDLAFLSRHGDTSRVLEDWLHGWGTALSPPLVGLAIFAVTLVVCTFDGPSGRIAMFVLALLGAASLVFTFSQQATHDRITDVQSHHKLVPWVIVSTVGMSALVVLCGFLGWLTAPRRRYE